MIEDAKLIVWESHSIIRYLAATCGSGLLCSDSPAVRSVADRWMDWSLATLEPDFMSLFWGYVRTPEKKHNAAAIQIRFNGDLGVEGENLGLRVASLPEHDVAWLLSTGILGLATWRGVCESAA